MAEEKAKEQQEEEAQEEPQRSGILSMIIMLLCVVLVGAIAALLVFRLVLKPRLSAEAPIAEKPPEIIAEPAMVQFDSMLASVIMPSEEYLPAMLIYRVELECLNAETAALIEKHRGRFTDMIINMHLGKTRKELDDPLTKQDILRQLVQKSNTMLLQIQGEHEGTQENRVTSAFHIEWFVKDDA